MWKYKHCCSSHKGMNIYLSLAPANFQGKMAPNAGFISKCVSSLVYWPGGKGPVLFCNRIPVYRFSSHLSWALIHAVGFCCQKGTNITNCPFGSQNTCNTCFFHLLRHLSSVNTTKANLYPSTQSQFYQKVGHIWGLVSSSDSNLEALGLEYQVSALLRWLW